MNGSQSYQSLVDKYKGSNQVVKKLGMSDLLIQLSIMGVIHAWRYVEIGYYHIAAPVLFFLSIYYLAKNFFASHRIEGNMAQMILEGIDIEAKNPSFGKFFHGILRSFNLMSILVQRSLFNVVVVICLGNLMIQFINDVNPAITISRWFVSLFSWAPGVIACKMYYDSLKELDEAKERVFATS